MNHFYLHFIFFLPLPLFFDTLSFISNSYYLYIRQYKIIRRKTKKKERHEFFDIENVEHYNCTIGKDKRLKNYNRTTCVNSDLKTVCENLINRFQNFKMIYIAMIRRRLKATESAIMTLRSSAFKCIPSILEL